MLPVRNQLVIFNATHTSHAVVNQHHVYSMTQHLPKSTRSREAITSLTEASQPGRLLLKPDAPDRPCGPGERRASFIHPPSKVHHCLALWVTSGLLPTQPPKTSILPTHSHRTSNKNNLKRPSRTSRYVRLPYLQPLTRRTTHSHLLHRPHPNQQPWRPGRATRPTCRRSPSRSSGSRTTKGGKRFSTSPSAPTALPPPPSPPTRPSPSGTTHGS